MQRVCFTLRVRPNRIEEYRRRHAEVWPEMRDALRQAGWRNYSLFLADDGVVIGYLECDNFESARAAMSASAVNGRWQSEMAPLFEDSHARPDEALCPLPEIFHLE